jgi:hypothetical protein
VNSPPALLVYQPAILLGLTVIATWAIVLRIYPELSGWSKLARSYASAQGFLEGRRGEIRPPSIDRQSITLAGFWRYSRCVTFEATDAGLRLSADGLFHHPSLILPWSNLSAHHWMLGPIRRGVTLVPSGSPEIAINISQQGVRWIRDQAGELWPSVRESDSQQSERDHHQLASSNPTNVDEY